MSKEHKRYKLWSSENVREALIFLHNISFYTIFGTMLHRQIVGSLIGTICAFPLADLFIFILLSLSLSLSGDKQIITETSPYSFGNFRKLSLYKCFMPI